MFNVHRRRQLVRSLVVSRKYSPAGGINLLLSTLTNDFIDIQQRSQSQKGFQTPLQIMRSKVLVLYRMWLTSYWVQDSLKGCHQRVVYHHKLPKRVLWKMEQDLDIAFKNGLKLMKGGANILHIAYWKATVPNFKCRKPICIILKF